MIPAVANVMALLMVLGQVVAIVVLFKVVQSFGRYTEQLMAAHKSNMLVHDQAIKLYKEVEHLRNETVVAQDIMLNRAANFTYNPHSDRERSA